MRCTLVIFHLLYTPMNTACALHAGATGHYGRWHVVSCHQIRNLAFQRLRFTASIMWRFRCGTLLSYLPIWLDSNACQYRVDKFWQAAPALDGSFSLWQLFHDLYILNNPLLQHVIVVYLLQWMTRRTSRWSVKKRVWVDAWRVEQKWEKLSKPLKPIRLIDKTFSEYLANLNSGKRTSQR